MHPLAVKIYLLECMTSILLTNDSWLRYKTMFSMFRPNLYILGFSTKSWRQVLQDFLSFTKCMPLLTFYNSIQKYIQHFMDDVYVTQIFISPLLEMYGMNSSVMICVSAGSTSSSTKGRSCILHVHHSLQWQVSLECFKHSRLWTL